MPALLGDDLPSGWRAASLPSMLDDRRLGADGRASDDAAGDRAQPFDLDAALAEAARLESLNWNKANFPQRSGPQVMRDLGWTPVRSTAKGEQMWEWIDPMGNRHEHGTNDERHSEQRQRADANRTFITARQCMHTGCRFHGVDWKQQLQDAVDAEAARELDLAPNMDVSIDGRRYRVLDEDPDLSVVELLDHESGEYRYYDPEARVFRAHLASDLDRFVGNWLDSTMPRRIAHVEDTLRMTSLHLPAEETLRMAVKDAVHHGGRGRVFRRWAAQQGADAESVERAWMLLAPRTAVTPSEGFAAAKPRVIYRGLLVEALDSDEVDEHIASFQSMSDAQIRAEVERALDADGHGGLTAGLHWSSSPTVAINFATGRDAAGYRTDYGDDATVLGLVLKAEIDPSYVISDVDSDEYADAMDARMAFGEDGGEEEVMPREGVPLRLTEAEFMVDGGEYDMLTVAYVRLDEHMQVTAMADRSGVPEVDQLIEEFLEVTVDEYGANDVLVKHLRDPENSHGMCDAITDQFVEFAKKRGFKAYVTHTDLDEMGYKPSIDAFGEIGFDENDEMQYGFYPEHTVATIVLKDPKYGPYGREIVVDFTASQYGYTDHPKVSKVVAGVGKAGRWWSAREGATAHFMTNDRRTACGRLIDPLIEEPPPMSRCGRCSAVMAGGWSKQYEPSRWEQGNHPNGADQRRRWQAHVLNTGTMTSEATRGADGRATEGM